MWRQLDRIYRDYPKFLLTHPVWDVTTIRGAIKGITSISTHTSRVGCDDLCHHSTLAGIKFLLTHPVWDVTRAPKHTEHREQNFYSHIPCGMWLYYINEQIAQYDFYSHIPCGMWRATQHEKTKSKKFLLTHPVWDVTAIYSIFQSHYSHILQDGPIIHLELY